MQHNIIIDMYPKKIRFAKLLKMIVTATLFQYVCINAQIINGNLNFNKNSNCKDFPELVWNHEDRISDRNLLPLYKTIPAIPDKQHTLTKNFNNVSYYTKWERSNANYEGVRYSSLNKINKNNIHKLKIAFIWKSGDIKKPNIEANPIIIENLAIFPATSNRIVAIDATNGKTIWDITTQEEVAKRGLTYWQGNEKHQSRIFFTAGNNLQAISPKDGQPIQGFGLRGVAGNGSGPAAPVIAKGIIAYAITKYDGSAPSIQGLDVITGKHLWTTQLIKELNIIESECMKKLGTKYKLEGANPWSGISVDQERGIVFVTTGDARGENNNRPGDNLYSNSIVAIDILNGQIIWSFQEVNHDIWDLDISAPPIVTSITRNDKKIDVVVAVTKLGNTIILDRLTGKPIYPFRFIRTVAPLNKRNYTSAYFPDPLIPQPFVKSKRINSNDIRIQSNAINLNIEFPPSYPSPKKESLVFGINGGAEWPGASVDPFSEIMYVASNNFYFLFPSGKPFLGADGNPGNKPPWGLLTALNLKSGEIIWSVPLGIDVDKSRKKSVIFGTKNLCGPVATAGGLVFCGGTTDKLFRAFDKNNGKELWRHELPAYGSAPPSIYQVNGKEYIIIPATGGTNGTLHEKKHDSSDSFVVFTLP